MPVAAVLVEDDSAPVVLEPVVLAAVEMVRSVAGALLQQER